MSSPSMRRWPRGLVGLGSMALGFVALAQPTRADVLVYADGRHAQGVGVRRDAQGRWTAECDGRRVILRPGDVVAVIDDEGVERDLIPACIPDALGPADQALLERVLDPRIADWMGALEALAEPPRRPVHDALVALASSPKKELRQRAVVGLVAQRTREGTLGAARAVLGERDSKARREAASALFSVQEIYRRVEPAALAESLRLGLEDKDGAVRIVFALLAPASVEAAAAVLRADGLGSRDHHARESAALALGRRGDTSGEAVLIAMLERKKLPGIDDPALHDRLLIKEHVAVCRVLWTFKTARSKAALEKARASPHAAVVEAATKAPLHEG